MRISGVHQQAGAGADQRDEPFETAPGGKSRSDARHHGAFWTANTCRGIDLAQHDRPAAEHLAAV